MPLGHISNKSGGRGREPFEDQVSSDIGDIIQVPKTDLMTRGVAVNLFEVAGRVGTQHEAAEHKNLSGEKSLPRNRIVVDDRTGHQTFCLWHNGNLNERTNVGVKTGRSWVGVPNYASED